MQGLGIGPGAPWREPGKLLMETRLKIFSRFVIEKVLFGFAADNPAGVDERPGRKLKRTRSEVNRNEAFGYVV